MITLAWRSWLKWKFGRSHHPCRAGRAIRTFRPQVEILEDRLAPAVMHPTYQIAQNGLGALSGGPTPQASGGFTPQQISHAYGFDQIAGDGTGQTIAIVDAFNDPNIVNDVNQFSTTFGLPQLITSGPNKTFSVVNQTGGISLPSSNSGWGLEISLDVEWAHAIAPGASILLVEASTASASDLLAAVDYARNATGVAVVSMSWGGGETSNEAGFDTHFQTPGGHTGVTFVASSGDSGAGVEWPSVSANVLSVGGTSLTLDSNNNWSSEAGWSGSGGGLSSFISQPTYQEGWVTQSTTYRPTRTLPTMPTLTPAWRFTTLTIPAISGAASGWRWAAPARGRRSGRR